MDTAITRAVTPRHFTYEWYEYFLNRLNDERYDFTGFKEALANPGRSGCFAILRHDIDFDTDKALEMATFEAERHISSTYFFLLSSSHYNIFEREVRGNIAKIVKLGHRLGLHFDTAAYPESYEAAYLNDMCIREARMLGDLFDSSVAAVSFHRPPDFILTGDTAFCSEYPHTYQAEFTREMSYLSDSRAMWKFGDPIERGLVGQHKNLHILIHPIWWAHDYRDGNDILNRSLQQKYSDLHQSFKNNCQIFRGQPQ
jgi:hypothetical protein